MKTKKLNIKSRTENLSLIRDFVSSSAAEAGVTSDVIENIILAVDEAIHILLNMRISLTLMAN